MLVGTVGGGLLGTFDLSLPYVVRAGMLCVVFAVAFATMHDLGFTPRALRFSDLPQAMRQVAHKSLTYGWHDRSVRLLMAHSFVQWSFLSWGFYAWQPYLLGLLGHEVVWVAGVIAALISVSTIIGNALVDWFSRFCGRRTSLLLWAAGAQTAAAVGVGLADNFWLAGFFLLIVTAAMGVTGPVKQAYLHQLIPSEQRASMISFDSMMGNAGGVIGQSGLGYLSRARSIADGYVVGGLATIFALPVLVLLRGLDDRSDRIVGSKAGIRGTCAAQGVPAISQVDSRPVKGARTGA